MTMNCPLPVDWLDLLEGRPSVATRAHLDECASCKAVVAALTNQPGALQMPLHLTQSATHALFSLGDVDDTGISEGQLRWLAVDDAEVRLPVVVLGPADEGTVDIVPLWTDRENATSADLLLNESDTTTGIAWRAVFRRQTVAPVSQLAVMFGQLTRSGEAAISQALAGRFAPEQTGADLESEFDPRLTADEWMSDVLRRALAQVEEPRSPGAMMRHTEPDSGLDVMWTDVSGVIYVLELKRVPEADVSGYALAAAPTHYRRSVLWAHLRGGTGEKLDASIRWDRNNDRLVLQPRVVKGLGKVVVIIVRSSQLSGPLKVSARLEPDLDVILSEGAGISDRDIDSLELQLA